MKKIDLLLTRHGETIENQRHVLQGQLPGTLSPLGKEQAVVLAEQLKQEPLDVIVCSDLARSYDTAKVVAGYHSLFMYSGVSCYNGYACKCKNDFFIRC